MTARSAEPPPIPGAEHRYVDAGGLRVHYVEAGSGDPVLLLHGWPQHHYLWRGIIERLSDRFRLIAPDLRGSGWTEAPGHGYDCDTFARDQIALLDALEIERADLIGHDWGGWVGFLLALSHPERIARLLVCNDPHPWPRLRPSMTLESWRTWYALLNATPGLGAFVHRRTGYIPRILRSGNVGKPFSATDIEVYVERLRDPARARAASALYRYYWRAFVKGFAGGWRSQRLTPRTLLLFGKRDRLVPYRLVEGGYEDHADDMRVEIVPDSGHFIVDEKPDLVAERALELFAAPVPSPSSAG